uniref:Uncharacterized protein n=1 Tax=Equus caballus TaxID=9796 RepID=A0A3Q2HS84_HORSE
MPIPKGPYQYRNPVIIQRRCCVLHDPDTVGEEEETALTHAPHDQKFAQEEEEVGNFQEEGVPGRGAEVGAVDGNLQGGIPVEEFDKLLQTPEAAFKTGHEELGKPVLCSRTFQALIQVLQHHSDDLHNGQNEGAKGQGACVRPAEGGEEREGRQVVWLVEGPVVGGEGPSQRDLAQGQHEVGQPEEHEDIEDLQAQQGPVVARLPAIEGELAVGAGAQVGFVGGGESLREGHRAGSQHRGQGFRVALGIKAGSDRPWCGTGVMGIRIKSRNWGFKIGAYKRGSRSNGRDR